jgi:hypothetical protein
MQYAQQFIGATVRSCECLLETQREDTRDLLFRHAFSFTKFYVPQCQLRFLGLH